MVLSQMRRTLGRGKMSSTPQMEARWGLSGTGIANNLRNKAPEELFRAIATSLHNQYITTEFRPPPSTSENLVNFAFLSTFPGKKAPKPQNMRNSGLPLEKTPGMDLVKFGGGVGVGARIRRIAQQLPENYFLGTQLNM